jgi:hypothetical protein
LDRERFSHFRLNGFAHSARCRIADFAHTWPEFVLICDGGNARMRTALARSVNKIFMRENGVHPNFTLKLHKAVRANHWVIRQ